MFSGFFNKQRHLYPLSSNKNFKTSKGSSINCETSCISQEITINHNMSKIKGNHKLINLWENVLFLGCYQKLYPLQCFCLFTLLELDIIYSYIIFFLFFSVLLNILKTPCFHWMFAYIGVYGFTFSEYSYCIFHVPMTDLMKKYSI